MDNNGIKLEIYITLCCYLIYKEAMTMEYDLIDRLMPQEGESPEDLQIIISRFLSVYSHNRRKCLL